MALSRACMSLSLRRAWIEMSRPQRRIPSLSSRSPYGERGLKSERSHSLPVGMRRSPYGERGLKYAVGVRHGRRPGRSPYGERGLKYRHRRKRRPQDQSLSLRRAWIEIRTEPFPASRHASLSLRRAWIEIFDGGWRGGSRGGRSPYGERGLKSCCGRGLLDVQASLSLRRAWIEISNPRPWNGRHESLSLRRAWIEISTRPSPASA